MISSYDRFRSHSGLFYQRNLQSQCTVYLPEQLTPKYSGRQIHRKYPLVLWHVQPPLVVFSYCTLVYVCKTGAATIQFAFFSKQSSLPRKRILRKQSSLINSMITDGIDSNLSPVTTTNCCSKYGYNSVIGLCPSYIRK